MDENDRQLALRVLRDTLRDTEAKPADRVRAAQLMLEAESAERAGPGALHDASDDELLRIARGQGGSPPPMGPKVPDASPVPSQAREVERDDPALIFAPASLSADRTTRTANPLLQKGPKRDPAPTAPPGGPPPTTERGPETDPLAKRPRGRPKKTYDELIAERNRPKKDQPVASQIKLDNTPARTPEPWE